MSQKKSDAPNEPQDNKSQGNFQEAVIDGKDRVKVVKFEEDSLIVQNKETGELKEVKRD